jgi:hypothetical protein
MIEMLSAAFASELVEQPTEEAPAGAICALTGRPLEGVGCRLKKIVSAASADIADTFRFQSEWVLPVTARLYKGSKILRGNLLATPEVGLRPFVAQESATEERPCWRDVIFSLEEGTPTVAIFSDESKRRLWPAAVVSSFGPNWRPFFHAAPYKGGMGESRLLMVNGAALRECLTLLEQIYSQGLPKRLIAQDLICVNGRKHIDRLGFDIVRAWESELATWRGRDEFLLGLFVAQKTGDLLWNQQQVQSPQSGGQLTLF